MDFSVASNHVTTHFTVNDCLFLHAFGRLATAADGADFDKLTILCKKLEEVRALLNCPMNVHCMFRSTEYNIHQGIFLPTGLDVHAMNLAVDFDCNGSLTIQEIKDILKPHLESLGIRMEFGTTTWVHLDLHAPGPSGRYFHV